MILSRKASVTEFIILGMIILIVALFLIYLRASLQEQEDTPQSTLLSSKLRAKSFELYVQSCLDTAFKESLDQLGEGGGYVLIPASHPLGGLSVLLTKNPSVRSAPDYPCAYADCQLFYDPALSCTNDLNYCQFTLDPPFAQSELLPIIASGASGVRSLTSQLETLMQERVKACMTVEGETPLANILPPAVSQGTPRVQLIHETQGITAELSLPFVLSFDEDHEQTTLHYQTSAPVRLRLLHSFIEELLYRDSSDLGFSIDTDFPKLTSYFPGFNVTVDRTTYAPLYDLVAVSDAFPSSIRFSFLREDLSPSLNYVLYSPDSAADIVLNAGEEIALPIFAYDPDEDPLTFSLAANPFVQLNGSQLMITGSSSGTSTVKLAVSDGSHEDYQMLRITVS